MLLGEMTLRLEDVDCEYEHGVRRLDPCALVDARDRTQDLADAVDLLARLAAA